MKKSGFLLLQIAVIGITVWGAVSRTDTMVASRNDVHQRVLTQYDPNRILAVRLGPFQIMSTAPNIDVNSPGNNAVQGETSVAINPKNPNIVIAGSNDDRSNHISPQQYIYLSTDGGATWINKPMPAGSSTYSAVTDPSVTYDANGVAYFGYGQFNQGSNDNTAVTVQRSLDGGFTWDPPTIVYANTAGTLEDKYIFAADANSSGQYKNNVYVSWTHFVNIKKQNQTSDIWFSRSTNAGLNWSAPIAVSSSQRGHLSMPAIGPAGEIYVVWAERAFAQAGLLFSRSNNGGVSFTAPGLVGSQSVWKMPDSLANKSAMRMITYPAAAVDNSPVHPGRVYVTWAALNGQGGSAHIYLTYSDNQGATWAAEKIIDGDPITGTDKFHPWIAVDPKNGAVAITFYDSRNDPANREADLYIAISRNGGQDFAVTRISNTTFPISPTNGYWADYTGVAAYKGKVIPCWTDQRSGNSIYNTDVYVSILGLGPNSVSNLSAVTGAATQTSIMLRWTDPTTFLSGDPLTNFTISIYRDSQFVTTVPKGSQTYTDDNLITGSYHTYQLYVGSGTDTSDAATTAGSVGGSLVPLGTQILSVREVATGTELTWKNPGTHIDGTPLYDLDAAFVYVDGVRQNIGLLPSDTGKVVSRTVICATGKFHWFTMTLGTQRQGLTAQSTRSDSVMWYAGAPHIAMLEGFESSPVLGVNDGWTTTTLGAHSGTHSLTDNNLGKTQSRQNIFAMLPPVVVQPNAPELSFWHVAVVAQIDSAVAEFSADHGVIWRAIGHYSQASGNGKFTETVSTSTWKNESFDLRPYIGDTVVVRFRMRTSSLNLHKQGWFIDDVTLRAPTAVRENFALPVQPLLVTASPNPFRATVWISAGAMPMPADAASVSLQIYDAAGRMVADLTPQIRADGALRARFDAANHPAGMYIARLRSGGREGTARFLLQR